MAARMSLDMLRRGGFRGARAGRGTNDWLTMDASADEDLLDDLPELRQRSLDLIKNDGRATGMHSTMVTSVIGRGINPEASLDHEALGLDQEKAAQIEKQMMRVWRTYFVKHADAGRRMHFNRIQRQAYWMRRAAGDYVVLSKMIPRPGRRLDFCLQTIDPARLDTPPDADRNKVRGGVKIGAYGEPLGYFIRKAHPGEYFGNGDQAQRFEYIPAEDAQGRKLVLHGYDVTRPGQSRGVPAFSSVLTEFRDVNQYREAERFAMRLAACIGLIIKESNPNGNNALVNMRNGKRVMGMEPGMIWKGGEDLNIERINPQLQGNNFEAFLRDVDRTLGLSQGMSYEIATKYFSEANYSSLRAGFVEARRFFRVEQSDFIAEFCQPCWEWAMEEAWLKGLLPDVFDFYDLKEFWCAVNWVPDGFDWVDPAKEVGAAIDAIEYKLSTRAEEIAKRTGGDWKDTLNQSAEEKRYMDRLGLTATVRKKTSKANDPKTDEQEQEDRREQVQSD